MPSFWQVNRNGWIGALDNLFGGAYPQSKQWTDLTTITSTLAPFTQPPHLNHTFFPKSGGLDLAGTRLSPTEDDALELHFQDFPSGSISLVRPDTLHFIGFKDYPQLSCFLLEVSPLPEAEADEPDQYGRQQLVELSAGTGRYAPRLHWDEGFFGYTENGNPRPLPDDARLVTRHVTSGRFLVAAKGGFYNHVNEHYDGRHNEMTPDRLREYIQPIIGQLEEQTEQSPVNIADYLTDLSQFT